MLGHPENLVDDFVGLQVDLLEMAELVQRLDEQLSNLIEKSRPHGQTLAKLCQVYLLLFERHPRERKLRERLCGLLLLKLAAEIGEHGGPRQDTVNMVVSVEEFIDGKKKSFQVSSEEDPAFYNDDILSYGEQLVELGHLLEDFQESCRDRLDLLHRVGVMYANYYKESFYNHAQIQQLEGRLRQFFFFCYAGEVRRSGRPGLSTVDFLTMLTALQAKEQQPAQDGDQ